MVNLTRLLDSLGVCVFAFFSLHFNFKYESHIFAEWGLRKGFQCSRKMQHHLDSLAFIFISFTPAAWTFLLLSLSLSSFFISLPVFFFIIYFFFLHSSNHRRLCPHAIFWYTVWWRLLKRSRSVVFVPSRKISITTLHLPQQWNSICLVDCFVSQISSSKEEKKNIKWINKNNNEFWTQTKSSTHLFSISFSFFFFFSYCFVIGTI